MIQTENLFTFQYGSTLMINLDDIKDYLEKFTFQYGSTLIKLSTQDVEGFKQIYIPIWFYFNYLS